MKTKVKLFITLLAVLCLCCKISFELLLNKEKEIIQQITIRENLSICSPVNLGEIKVNLTPIEYSEAEREISTKYANQIEFGGYSTPKDCYNKDKVAIIVPLRSRPIQLAMFMKHYHPILLKQKLTYQIFVVEQVDKLPFNKAAIYNVAFRYATGLNNFNCVIFNDIDFLLETEYGMYNCPESPFHMGRWINIYDYKIDNPTYIGGVISFTVNDYIKINGHSNCYWGWGYEDDDISTRTRLANLEIKRAKIEQYKYTMSRVNHVRDNSEVTFKRKKIFNTGACRAKNDGLNNMKSKIISTEKKKLYTHIKVDLTDQKIESTEEKCLCL